MSAFSDARKAFADKASKAMRRKAGVGDTIDPEQGTEQAPAHDPWRQKPAPKPKPEATAPAATPGTLLRQVAADPRARRGALAIAAIVAALLVGLFGIAPLISDPWHRYVRHDIEMVGQDCDLGAASKGGHEGCAYYVEAGDG